MAEKDRALVSCYGESYGAVEEFLELLEVGEAASVCDTHEFSLLQLMSVTGETNTLLHLFLAVHVHST